MSNACCNSLSLSSYHLPVPLYPLVDTLVACQRLTSLELEEVTLSLQSLLALVKGLHNLRALGLYSVSLSDGEVSSSEEEASSSSDEASDERVSD